MTATRRDTKKSSSPSDLAIDWFLRHCDEDRLEHHGGYPSIHLVLSGRLILASVDDQDKPSLDVYLVKDLVRAHKESRRLHATGEAEFASEHDAFVWMAYETDLMKPK